MRRLLFTAALLSLAAAALANDSTASTGAGGLVLERTEAIEMASEDLYVSADQIRIRYVFRNRTARDVTTIVAFPMPDRDLSEEYEGDVAYPSDFRTRVAGVPVTAQLERKAIVKGRDHTALLQRLGIPLAPDAIRTVIQVMDRLPVAEKRRLQSLGIASDEQYDDTGKGMEHHLVPLWTVQEKYWWRQRFPASRDLVVEHQYVPGVGRNNGTGLLYPDTPETREQIARYCIDKQFLATVNRLDKAGRVPMDRWIDYILTTGANWARPIGDFRLVVDKGKPGNLVSFCETGVTKISPTQFEVRHRNWRPTRDLHVLIIEPAR